MEKKRTTKYNIAQNTTMADAVIDLITPEKVNRRVSETIDLLSQSSDEDLTALFDKLVPLPPNDVVVIDSSDGAEESSDDSSIGIGRGIGDCYGEFWPLFDLKRSIAPFGYIDYRDEGNDDALSCDSWYLDRCWWLETPKTSVAPSSWQAPAFRSCTKEKTGASALPREILVGCHGAACFGVSGVLKQVQKFS